MEQSGGGSGHLLGLVVGLQQSSYVKARSSESIAATPEVAYNMTPAGERGVSVGLF
jgi:hypothetical protein